MSNININYSQFYSGTERISSYGSNTKQKNAVVKYGFNTTYGDGNKDDFIGEKEYVIILSDDKLNILKSGSTDEKENLYKLIKESMKKLSQLKESHKADNGFKGIRFGINIGKDDEVSFFSQSDNGYFEAKSINDLLNTIDINEYGK
ncbi:MAG: hypothetical protein IJ736_14425 [Firmicutes bacterium]|nr:hypothetical protein [Bacillota bacterium]